MLKIIKKIFGRAAGEQSVKGKIGLPDVNGKVDRSMLEGALDFLISLEPDPESPDAIELYDLNREKYKSEVVKANKIIRLYGEQIEPKTLEHMQEKFYEIVNSSKYQQSSLHSSVVYSSLSYGWNGIGAWQR